MHQLASDEKSTFPIGSKIILRDFYVDDLITGGQSTQQVLEIISQTINLLARGGNGVPTSVVWNKHSESFTMVATLPRHWVLLGTLQRMSFVFLFLPYRSLQSHVSDWYFPQFLGLTILVPGPIGPGIAKAKIFLKQVWRERLRMWILTLSFLQLQS